MAWFREKLSRLWSVSPKANDKASDTVSSEEMVARFVYRSRDYSSRVDPPRPKQSAFMPEFYDGRWETSVCRISAIDESRIWHRGDTVRAGMVAEARADVPVAAIRTADLDCTSVREEQYPEHAVIVGWPTDEVQKARQKAKAAALVEAATLRFPPKAP